MTNDLHKAVPRASETVAEEPVDTIDNPRPKASPEEQAEAEWLRIRASPSFSEALFGHCHPAFLAKAPIRLYGVSGAYCLYRNAEGELRALHAEEHDQAGIASLFAGAEGWLRRLWPARDGGWDEEKASETLMHFSACIGVIDAAALGFVIEPDWPR